MSVKIRCPECNSDRLNVYNTTLITQCSDIIMNGRETMIYIGNVKYY